MCLGELGEVVRVEAPGQVEVRVGARATTVSLVALPDPTEPVEPGDWLLVHAGFALARLTSEDAAEAQDIRRRSTR